MCITMSAWDELRAEMAPPLLFSLQGRCDFGMSAPSHYASLRRCYRKKTELPEHA